MGRRNSEEEVHEEVKRLLEREEKEETITEIKEEPKIITNIVKKIEEINFNMKELEDYLEFLPNLQSKVDEELSDLLHYIENEELSPQQAYKITKLIKNKRQERRKLCNDFEIKRVYYANKTKLLYNNQRDFFMTEIHKREKELNGVYRYRRITKEEIEKEIKGRKKESE